VKHPSVGGQILCQKKQSHGLSLTVFSGVNAFFLNTSHSRHLGPSQGTIFGFLAPVSQGIPVIRRLHGVKHQHATQVRLLLQQVVDTRTAIDAALDQRCTRPFAPAMTSHLSRQ